MNDIVLFLVEEQLLNGNFYLQNDNFYNLKEDIIELLELTIPEEYHDDLVNINMDELIDKYKQNILQFSSLSKHEFKVLDKAIIEKQIN